MKPSSQACRRVDDRGATAVEYALLASLIALVIFATVASLGDGVHNLYQDSCNKLAAAASSGSC